MTRIPTDTPANRHWSKQFWPWFLILLPSCAVIASMVTITLAVQNAPTITDREIGRFARTEHPEKIAEQPTLDTRPK